MLQLVGGKFCDESSQRQVQASQQRFRLAKLLLRTEAILNNAMAGEWAEVESLELERQAEMAACFSSALSDDSGEVVQALTTLVHMNREITRLVEHAKETLLQEQEQARARHHVAQAYTANARTGSREET